MTSPAPIDALHSDAQALEAQRRVRTIQMATVSLNLLALPFVLWYGVYLRLVHVAVVLIAAILASDLNLWWMLRGGSAAVAGNVLTGLTYTIFLFSTVVAGGFPNLVCIWFALLPVTGGLLVGPRTAAAWGTVALLTVSGLIALPVLGLPLPNRLPEYIRPVQDSLNLAGLLAAQMAICVVFAWFQLRSQRELDERNRELALTHEALQLAQARLVISEKLATLGRMLAGLSHEINNPLNAIVNSVGPLRDDLDTIDRVLSAREGADGAPGVDAPDEDEVLDARQDAREIADVLEAASLRIQNVHMRLRDFVRGSKSPDGLSDVRAGLLATVEQIRRDLPAEVELELELADLPPIRGRAEELNQMILNILQNAVAAVGSEGAISVRAAAQDGFIEMVVDDDGPGIPTGVLERAFEPFFTTREVGQAMGLGLTISREIASRHGGSVDLKRGASAGTRVVCRIPIDQAQAAC